MERERGLGQRLAGDADELANLQQRRARNLSI
jgi:hypothetical protein